MNRSLLSAPPAAIITFQPPRQSWDLRGLAARHAISAHYLPVLAVVPVRKPDCNDCNVLIC